jgi:hypothetical protein
MRAADLLKRLEDHRFRPFRVHLSDGTKIVVRQPGMVIVGLSSAIVPTEFTKDSEGMQVAKDWRTVALAHIVQFTEVNGNGKDRHRK